MALSEVSAAVLIGGRSRRMGVPKALLRLDPAGDTLVERVVARLSQVASEVLLVGTPAWPLPTALAGRETVADRGVSAIDGVIAALAAAQHECCLIVGCDMPFLDPGLLAAMCEVSTREAAGVAAADASGLHPLHAVYRRGAMPAVAGLVARGERSLARAAAELGMASFRTDGDDAPAAWRWSVFNVNTPADLALARCHDHGEA